MAPTTSTRFLVNDTSVKLGIPVVHGSIFRFEGMVTVFDPKNGPDLPGHGPRAPARRDGTQLRGGGRPRRPPGIVGSIQAIETIKLLLDLGDPLVGRLLAYGSLEQSFRGYKVRTDPANEITWANRDRIVVAGLDASACRTRCRRPPPDRRAPQAGRVAAGSPHRSPPRRSGR